MSSARILRPILIACAMVAAMAVPVSAESSQVTIQVTQVGDTQTFTTSGGALCPGGTAETTFEKFGGSFIAGAAGSFHGYTTLTCSDGSGSFRITFDAATVFGSPQDQGGWHVIDGTDDYAGMTGGGNLVGTYIPNGIIDLYTGRVSLH
jgi:hypothetical protein